jgi:Fic family protein
LETGGKYKNSDNAITEVDSKGNKKLRFAPVPAWETSESIVKLCKAYEDIMSTEKADPLIIIPMFVLDFLCIHPFSDGNGRISRLLTLLLLYRSGYIVGKYISIEKLIEATKETYYEALQESSLSWHEEKNNYEPFVKYTLGVVANAYREFSTRVKQLTTTGMSKPDRIRELIKDNLGKITKAEIMQKCPDISQVTVQRALNEMHKKGEIIKISGGRYTTYVWNREDE